MESLPGSKHPVQPVDRCMHIASPKALMKGRDNIVMLFTILIIWKGLTIKGLLNVFQFQGIRTFFTLHGIIDCRLKVIECNPRVTRRDVYDVLNGLRRYLYPQPS